MIQVYQSSMKSEVTNIFRSCIHVSMRTRFSRKSAWTRAHTHIHTHDHDIGTHNWRSLVLFSVLDRAVAPSSLEKSN